jgi:acyl-CoA thioesterase I
VEGRLDEVIACRPDMVTLLIGTNDVLAHTGRWMARLLTRWKRLTEPPTPHTYRRSVEHILDRLQAETSARLGVIEIPPLGERSNNVQNRRIGEYNSMLHEIAAARDIEVLPLNSAFVAAFPPDHDPPPFRFSPQEIARIVVRSTVLKEDSNQLSKAMGLTLFTDQVHPNQRGADIIAATIAAYVGDD